MVDQGAVSNLLLPLAKFVLFGSRQKQFQPIFGRAEDHAIVTGSQITVTGRAAVDSTCLTSAVAVTDVAVAVVGLAIRCVSVHVVAGVVALQISLSYSNECVCVCVCVCQITACVLSKVMVEVVTWVENSDCNAPCLVCK